MSDSQPTSGRPLISPFARKMTKAKRQQAVAFWLFRLITYAIIAFATYIFADIALKGSKTVFTSKAPFINVEFFTGFPETLYVFDYYTVEMEGETLGVGSREFNQLIRGQNRKLSSIDYHHGVFKFQYEYQQHEPLAPEAFFSFLAEHEVKLRVLEYAEHELPATRFNEWREERGIALSDDLGAKAYAYSGGGILPNIVGTFLLTVGAVIIALILGTLAAVFLSEYSKPGKVLNTIRLSILNLAGVPSVVFGIFGFGAFVLFLGWNVSLLAGCFTLAFMVLPVIIAASEESLRAIPQGFRESSLALGATKWTAIRTNVIPYAIPGVLTSSILGVTRVAGETAPILFTAAYASAPGMPWDKGFWNMFMEPVMALPYHIYVVSLKIPQNEYTEKMQYGTSFVFMLIVGLIALFSIVLRVRARRKYKW